MPQASATPSLFFDLGIATNVRLPEQIQDPGLKRIAQAFSSNAENILGLFALPIATLSVGGAVHDSHTQLDFIRAMTNCRADATKYGKDPDTTSRVDAELKRLWEIETKNKVEEDIERRLRRVLDFPFMANTLRMVKSSGISAAWTTFETVCYDSWVYFVNSNPKRVGNHVIEHIGKKRAHGKPVRGGDIISTTVLRKYGFDLSRSLGNILCGQFDFTKLSGIRTAFAAAFPSLPAIKPVLQERDLALLQAYRHCIVHRAGIMDEQFVATCQLEHAKPNDLLPLEDERVRELVNAGLHAGRELLQLLDGWVNGSAAV